MQAIEFPSGVYLSKIDGLLASTTIQIYLFTPKLSTSPINTKKLGDKEKTVQLSVSGLCHPILKVDNLMKYY